jgi:hypothetical protein
MKKFLIAGAAVAAFAVTPALAQQAVVRGDSTQARSQVSQTAPIYRPTYGGGYVANYGGGYAMGYAPQGYVAAGPYAAAGAPYGFMPVDGPFNPGVSDQERTLFAQLAPTIGWPGGYR